MIDEALSLLRDELSSYIELNGSTGDGNKVKLDNIANLDNNNAAGDLQDKVIISLVNIEEESTFKNVKSVRQNQFTGAVEYNNPPVFLNLYVLFSCTLADGTDGYKNSLSRLALVVQFFQSRKTFTLGTALNYTITDLADREDHEIRNLENLKIIVDLYTLTFEQINHLWGSLGGKQVPFAMYKVRLVEIKDEQSNKGGSLITEIQSKENIN